MEWRGINFSDPSTYPPYDKEVMFRTRDEQFAGHLSIATEHFNDLTIFRTDKSGYYDDFDTTSPGVWIGWKDL